MSLSDGHGRQSLVFDVYHMYVEVIYHQLWIAPFGISELTVRRLIMDKQPDLVLLHTEFLLDYLSGSIPNIVQQGKVVRR
jgi:hypothetical protein